LCSPVTVTASFIALYTRKKLRLFCRKVAKKVAYFNYQSEIKNLKVAIRARSFYKVKNRSM